MARIAGIDLPKNKRGEIGLTYIFGIGKSTAQQILNKAGIDVNKKVQDWTDDEQNAIRNIINEEYKVEGDRIPVLDGRAGQSRCRNGSHLQVLVLLEGLDNHLIHLYIMHEECISKGDLLTPSRLYEKHHQYDNL